MTAKSPEVTNIQLAGVGGQGVLLVSNIIGQSCVRAGKNVLSSEVHGMAQRGGVVLSTVRIGDVFSPMIALGEADVLLAFEPSEAVRASEVVSKRTKVVVSTRPIIPFSVGIWGQKYPPVESMLDALRSIAGGVIAVDAEALAKQAGSKITVNIVMLGALMGCGVVPLPTDVVKQTIADRVPKKFLDMNMKAFELGMAAARGK